MKKVYVSLKELYLENGAWTENGYYIDFYSDSDYETEYYDLRTDDPDKKCGELLLCDGEGCLVTYENNDIVTLENEDGIEIHLTRGEYNIAVFE